MTAPIPAPATSGQRETEAFRALIDSLLDTYRPEGVLIWLTSGNRNFGGYSPRQLIADGDWQPLLDEAERLAGGPRWVAEEVTCPKCAAASTPGSLHYDAGPQPPTGRETCECSHDRGYHGNADGQTGWQARCGHPDCDCEDFVADPTACDSCGSRDPYECYDGCGCPDCDDEDDDVPAAAAVSGGQPTDEGLREEIARAYATWVCSPYDPTHWQTQNGEDLANAVLALPAVARPIAAEAAVQRVRTVLSELEREDGDWHGHDYGTHPLTRLRSALDGPR